MRRVFIILALLVATNFMFAQKSQYTMEKIGWINPWTTSSNQAGLTLNETFLKDIGSFTGGTLAGYMESGDLKNIYDPQSTFGGDFDIASYIKLGKAYLKGGFGYDYSHSRHSTWRGWYDPYSTPFILADSIPGNLSLEMYNMEAALAYPASERISLGLDLRYDVGIMAKHRDLRNRNTIMNFTISPSFVYTGENVNLGLALGYQRGTEKVEYLQVDSSSEKYLFSIYGLWLYYSTGYSGAETSRENLSDIYSGALTLDLTFGKFRIFNDFQALYSTAMQGETGYNNLLHGQTNKLTYSDRLTLLYGFRHRVDLNLEFYTMTGNRFLQRQELDPQSNIRIWVTYGGPINYYYRSFRSEELSYTYRQAKSHTDVDWEITAGVRECAVSHKYKETPLVFSQNLTTREGYLRYDHHLKFTRSGLDISPNVAYSFSSGLMNDTTQGQNRYQLEKQLVQEYDYWAAPKVKFGLGAEYHFGALSILGRYQGAAAISGALKGATRHQGSIGIGFRF